jgi:ABC-type phosphate transport system substrate-binding protein
MKCAGLFLGLVTWAHLVAADIVGSDLLAKSLTPGLAKSVPRLKIDLSGSLPARRQLQAKEASLGLLFLREDEKPPQVEKLQAVLYAHAAVVVMVHRSNTAVYQINFTSLAGVFGKEARTRVLNWNDLPDVTRSELILPGMFSPEGSYVRELFQGLVLEGQPFQNEPRWTLTEANLRETLSSRAGCLVLAPTVMDRQVGKVLNVSDGRPGKSSTPYSPDEMNIYNGDYPLRLPLYLYYREDQLATLRPALLWLYSDEAAGILQAQGLHPTPKVIRDRHAQRLDTR